MNQQFLNRISERVVCSIEVQAGDTLNAFPATVVDLSRHGAQVQCGAQFEAGKTIHLDLGGEYAWATVAWSEIDRMGVKFVVPLSKDSALGRRLESLQGQRQGRTPAAAPQRLTGFGRRQAA